MTQLAENNKRIAKNTLLLYIRLFVTMVIGLFTSRVILSTLGVTDYGVNNVVAGFVAMFSMFTNSLSAAISRFLTFNLGKGDAEKLKTVFSTSVNIMIAMAIIVTIVAEIFGLWFLNSKLNIPADRMYAANWVFHFSVITFAVNLISIPYNASIIAHEKMDVFAYISILEVVLKLAVVYMLYISPLDKLITYSFLLLLVSVFIRIVYGIYCSRKLKECCYSMVFDRTLLKEMGGFAGWNMLGTACTMFNTQGVNILMNLFFGVVTNAARGIVNQVESVIVQFVSNFTTALNPQVTKSYASGNLDYMHSLVYKGTKFSYYLILIMALPFMFEAEFVLKLWLGEYPEEAPLFLRLAIIATMVDRLGNTTAVAAWATGNIKKYYIIVSATIIFVFPLTYIAYKIGAPAYVAYLIFIIFYFVIMWQKVFILKGLTGFQPKEFLKNVMYPITITTIMAILIPLLTAHYLADNVVGSILQIIISVMSSIVAIYLFGLTKGEKALMMDTIQSRIKRIHQ